MNTTTNDVTIEKAFPNGVLRQERWGTLVNGLDKDAIPHGKILGSAVSDHEKDRIFHILDINDERVKIGVFKTPLGEENACYALILERVRLGSKEADDMVYSYEEKIRSGHFVALPKDVSPTIENANRCIDTFNSESTDLIPF